ncbi:hypothetical protein [Nocardia harenae]|uniref:hypothetical protein n=1 Tax=Nocardia harenae TaxID=358707 RepID=UPI000833D13F|nr:hypothetical protein [Nocardia harenae]
MVTIPRLAALTGFAALALTFGAAPAAADLTYHSHPGDLPGGGAALVQPLNGTIYNQDNKILADPGDLAITLDTAQTDAVAAMTANMDPAFRVTVPGVATWRPASFAQLAAEPATGCIQLVFTDNYDLPYPEPFAGVSFGLYPQLCR